jgi:putative membrane protein
MVRWVLANVGRGLAMGAADVVPGVSGGTVALLLGIYDRLVGQVAHLSAAGAQALRGRLRGALAMVLRAEWGFLAGLAAGIAVAIVALVEVVRWLIDEQPVGLSAAFFGLVAMTVATTRSQVSRWSAGLVVIFVAVGVGVFLVLGVRAGSVADPAGVVIIGAGALAICAMILPGISGAFVLLLLGLYDPITEAVSERDIGTILLFGLGAALGLAVFSRLLQRLLDRWRDAMIAVLMGLMAGSLRVLWPWPVGDADSGGFGNAALGAPAASDVAVAVVAAAAAAAAAVALHRVGTRQASP